jgi:hypothetical protein
MLGRNGGFVVGPVGFGALVTATAWTTTGWVIADVTLVGAAAGWRARVR